MKKPTLRTKLVLGGETIKLLNNELSRVVAAADGGDVTNVKMCPAHAENFDPK
jgi:hypothetical protein